MKKTVTVLYFLTLVIAASNVFAESSTYTISASDTLETILKKRFNNSTLYSTLEFKIKRYNPHISDWSKLVPGVIIFTGSPLSPNISNYHNAYLGEACKVNRTLIRKNRSLLKRCQPKYRITSKRSSPLKQITNKSKHSLKRSALVARKNRRRYNSSFFYTFSKGTLSELVGAVESSTVQDSPITVGASVSKKVSRSFYFSSSVYLSKFSDMQSLGSVVTLPLEYGLTSHLSYKLSNIGKSNFYVGVDYEHLSSFNIDELTGGALLSTREHGIGYISLGLSHYISLWNNGLFIKYGYSKSLFSSQSRASLLSSEKFMGSKLMLYLNYKIFKRWSAHVLFKQHSLIGATKLTINRLGVGLGFHF